MMDHIGMCSPKGYGFSFWSKNGYYIYYGLLLPILVFNEATRESVGGQGWGSGESTRLPPSNVARVQIPASTPYVGLAPGLLSGAHHPLLLVLSLVPRGFSPGSPVFPSPQKPTLPNSIQFDLKRTDKFKRVHMNS